MLFRCVNKTFRCARFIRLAWYRWQKWITTRWWRNININKITQKPRKEWKYPNTCNWWTTNKTQNRSKMVWENSQTHFSRYLNRLTKFVIISGGWFLKVIDEWTDLINLSREAWEHRTQQCYKKKKTLSDNFMLVLRCATINSFLRDLIHFNLINMNNGVSSLWMSSWMSSWMLMPKKHVML